MTPRRSSSAVSRFVLAATMTAAALAGSIAIAPAAQAAQAAPAAPAVFAVANGVRLNTVEARLLTLINRARVNRKLPALSVAPGYTDVARRWSAKLAQRRVLSHNPDARNQLQGAGGQGWRVLGENVGFGGDADSLFDAYWNSPKHRANIINPTYRYIGIGWVALPDGTGYNTQNFVSCYSASYGPTRVAVRAA